MSRDIFHQTKSLRALSKLALNPARDTSLHKARKESKPAKADAIKNQKARDRYAKIHSVRKVLDPFSEESSKRI